MASTNASLGAPTPSRSALLVSFGCKVNRYDTGIIQDRLTRAGFAVALADQPTPDADTTPPDWIILNTCAVTAEAERQARQAARRWRRHYPEARIVLTGCYAQTGAASAAKESGADWILGGGEKFHIEEILNQPQPDKSHGTGPRVQVGNIFSNRDAQAFGPAAFGSRARAFVKIQDGCDWRCSYCIIPRARGRSRWAGADEVVAMTREHALAGRAEVALVGVHLGDWGGQPGALADLCARIEAETPLKRLRLSSLDPHEFDSPLLDLISQSRILCDHFHIPLQSGDDGILERMRRPYTAAQYAEITQRLVQRQPNAAVGTDVLVGFPGESEEAFERTYALLEATPTALVHAFPFSARPGSPAANMEGRVAPEVVRRRMERLKSLGATLRARFQASQIGRRLELVVEGRWKQDPRYWNGLSRNYLPVRFLGQAQPGALVEVTPTRVTGEALFADEPI